MPRGKFIIASLIVLFAGTVRAGEPVTQVAIVEDEPALKGIIEESY